MTSDNINNIINYNPRIAHSILLKAYYSSHESIVKSDISNFAYSTDNIEIITTNNNDIEINTNTDNVDLFEFNKVKNIVHLGLRNFYNKLTDDDSSTTENRSTNNNNSGEIKYSLQSFLHIIKTFIYDSVYYNRIVAHMSRKEFFKIKDLIEEARVIYYYYYYYYFIMIIINVIL